MRREPRSKTTADQPEPVPAMTSRASSSGRSNALPFRVMSKRGIPKGVWANIRYGSDQPAAVPAMGPLSAIPFGGMPAGIDDGSVRSDRDRPDSEFRDRNWGLDRIPEYRRDDKDNTAPILCACLLCIVCTLLIIGFLFVLWNLFGEEEEGPTPLIADGKWYPAKSIEVWRVVAEE